MACLALARLVLCVSVFAALLSGVTAVSWTAATFKALGNAAHSMAEFFDGVTSNTCAYASDPAARLDQIFDQRFFGQQDALNALKESVQIWQRNRDEGIFRPLVVAITGSTGVGKSESAHAVAEAVLEKRQPGAQNPTGWLELRGEDYSDPTAALIATYQKDIKVRIVEHLKACAGHGVIVFDEAQKAIPSVLDVLTSVMDGEHASISHGSTTLDCTNVVVIIISDIGVPRMREVIVQAHATERTQPGFLRTVARKLTTCLEDHWKGLNFVPLVNKIVPFPPLTPDVVQGIVTLKLSALSNASSSHWSQLTFSDSLPRFLSSTKFISYIKVTDPASGQAQNFARNGARDVHVSFDGPMERLKNALTSHVVPATLASAAVDCDQTGDGDSESETADVGADGSADTGRGSCQTRPRLFVTPTTDGGPTSLSVFSCSRPISTSTANSAFVTDAPSSDVCDLVWSGEV